MSSYHLAQVNIATMLAPLSDPIMADFVAQLQAVNQAADHSPGFIWRLQSDQGNATQVRAYADERILFNLSVWASIQTLSDYVYRSQHGAAMRDRRRWFEPSQLATTALWWMPAGVIPSVSEACTRLEYLRQHGPTAYAFTFRQPFAAEVIADPVLERI